MNIIQRIVRHGHVPFYATMLLWETLRAWGLKAWLAFWFSRQERVPVLEQSQAGAIA